MALISILKVILNVKFKLKGRRGTRYRPEITSARAPKWSQTTASLPGQPTQPWPLTRYLTVEVKFHLTFMVNFKIKGRDTEYRHKITTARVPKWFQTIARLPEQQLTQPKPLTWHFASRWNLRSKDVVSDIVSKLRQHAYQNVRKQRLASLGRLLNNDLWSDIWPSIWLWRSTARSGVMVVWAAEKG